MILLMYMLCSNKLSYTYFNSITATYDKQWNTYIRGLTETALITPWVF